MSASDSEFKTGLQIVGVIVLGIVLVAGPLWYLEVGGDLSDVVTIVGALVGGALGFVAASYFMFGR